MKRSLAVLVLAVALLSFTGCVAIQGGVEGEGNGTATPTATPDQSASTPTADSSDGGTDSGLPYFNVTASAPATVTKGNSFNLTYTVRNIGKAQGTQTIEFRAGEQTLDQFDASLNPGETYSQTLTIPTTNTAPGATRYTLATENTSTSVTVEIEKNERFSEFFADVQERTVDIRQTRVFGPEVGGVAFRPNKQYEEEYFDGKDIKPTPHAVALELATTPPEQAPETVNVALIVDGEGPVWGANVTRDLAVKFINGSMTPYEFRNALWDSAVGEYTDRSRSEFPAHIVAASGERARLAYAKFVARDLRNANASEHYTVTDYGLYNKSYYLNNHGTLKSSMFVELQIPRESQTVRYRGFNSTKAGAAEFETLIQWGQLADARVQGELPESLHLRIVDQEGKRIYTYEIPAEWAIEAIDPDAGGGVVSTGFRLDDTTREVYNGGTDLGLDD